MDMSFRNKPDGETLFLGILRITIEVTHRVDHDGLSLRRENVGVLCLPLALRIS
jgi:hypothetical protein